MTRTNNIALIFDFDLTLTPNFSEKPIFDFYNYDMDKFWDECTMEYEKRVAELNKRKRKGRPFDARRTLSKETVYADLLVKYAQEEKFKELGLDKLKELGKKIEFHPGIPGFFVDLKKFIKIKESWKKYNINLDFYVLSCAIQEMIEGSEITPYLTDFFATEFSENEKGIDQAIYKMSYTEKTKFLYLINKGPEFNENDYVPRDSRRIDGKNMIYIGDGQSDVPCSATIKKKGGKVMGIYRSDKFEEVYRLHEQKRFDHIGPADYTTDNHTMRCLRQMISDIADNIVEETEEKISKAIGIHPQI